MKKFGGVAIMKKTMLKPWRGLAQPILSPTTHWKIARSLRKSTVANRLQKMPTSLTTRQTSITAGTMTRTILTKTPNTSIRNLWSMSQPLSGVRCLLKVNASESCSPALA
jgi:hypothetical protein